MNRLIRIALTFLLVMTSGVIQAEIVIYPVPQGIYYARHNDDYTVKVRQVGEKDWVDLYEYNVKVDMDTKSDATMVQFDFSGKVEVLVQKNNGELRSAVVRPLSKGIQPEIDGNFLLFTLDKPQKLSVEFNSFQHDCLSGRWSGAERLPDLRQCRECKDSRTRYVA